MDVSVQKSNAVPLEFHGNASGFNSFFLSRPNTVELCVGYTCTPNINDLWIVWSLHFTTLALMRIRSQCKPLYSGELIDTAFLKIIT